jgi:hypothetical protein
MLAAEVASLESQLQDVKLRPEKATSLLRRVNEKLKSSARELEARLGLGLRLGLG